MAQQIQLRRGTAAAWTTANTILLLGELGFETDTLLYKIGDGTTGWNSLAYRELSSTLNDLSLVVPTSEPSAPSAGRLNLYPWPVAGRIVPKFIGPAGLDSVIQPAIFGNGMHIILPGTSTVPTVIGGPNLTSVGTVSHPTLSATSLVSQTSRLICVSSALANSVADMRVAFARVWRSNVAGLGGFFHRSRFSIESVVATQQIFVGFSSATTAFSTTQVPSALTNCFGVGCDAADTNLQIINNDGAGTASKTSLGVNFPNNDPTVLYDFSIFAKPNDTAISYTLTNLKTGAVANGTISTDLPMNTVFLAYRAYINNGGTAAAVTLGLARSYTETDY